MPRDTDVAARLRKAAARKRCAAPGAAACSPGTVSGVLREKAASVLQLLQEPNV